MLDDEIEKEMMDPYFRYMNDIWLFAMLLSTGYVLGFQCIDGFYGDYLTISAVPQSFFEDSPFTAFGKIVVGAPTERITMHIRIDSIIAMCELSDS